MRKFIVKRLLLSVVILFFVTFIIYVLMRCLPTSYVEAQAIRLSQTPGSKPYDEWLAQLNAQYGLDQDIIPGFFQQLGHLLRLDFGDSWKFTIPVLDKFNQVIWISFIMGAVSMVLELVIAIPLGIIAATKQYSMTDYTISAVALAGISFPTFFFATLLKLVFSV
ncbi:MAG: ABC transporter permease, partial [Roseburia sp.]|nr:ABC transporter permease [Roseburia sp.]